MLPDPKKPIPDMPPPKKGKRILGCNGCDERDAEIARLRAEVEALRAMLAQAERDIEEMPVGCGCADDI